MINVVNYIAASKRKEILDNSSSGGIFTTVAEYFLKSGGVVCGAIFDKDTYSIRHIVSDDYEDIKKMRKSKYVMSCISECYDTLEKALTDGKNVLFTGTPCQVELIKRKYGKYENLYCCDFFCHGVAEKRFFTDYLRLLPINCIKCDFRANGKDDINFNFEIVDENGIYLSEQYTENIFTLLFIWSASMCNGCFKCGYYESKNIADMTFGDFDFKEIAKQNGVDVAHPSILCVNSKKGEKLFEEIKENLFYSRIKDNSCLGNYYRPHTFEGEWGYNYDIRKKFIDMYKKYGFMKAAYKTLFPEYMDVIETIGTEDTIDVVIYGAGIRGTRMLRAIKDLGLKWELKSFLVSKKTDIDEKMGVHVTSLDEYKKKRHFDDICIVAVDKKYQDEIKKSLESFFCMNKVYYLN